MTEALQEFYGTEVEQISWASLQWLRNRYGAPGQRWFYLQNVIYFRSPKDKLMFELAWCQ
jgi:hypothetical protein